MGDEVHQNKGHQGTGPSQMLELDRREDKFRYRA
jgi:hypothetical protein